MSDLSNVKPGDVLYVWRNRGHGDLIPVDRVTPSGRVIAGHYTFERTGYAQGERSVWSYTYARLATQDDIASVKRDNLVAPIARFNAWSKLSPDDLNAVAAIVDRYKDKAP